MPASATLGEDASDFQYNFLKSGGLPLVLSMLTRNNFLPSTDMETRRGAYLNALKIAKLLLTAVGFGHVKAVAEACQPNAEGNIPVSPVRLRPVTQGGHIPEGPVSSELCMSDMRFFFPPPSISSTLPGACAPPSPPLPTSLQINQATHDQALVLQSALQNIPNPASECMLRNVAIRLAQQISDEVTENVRN